MGVRNTVILRIIVYGICLSESVTRKQAIPGLFDRVSPVWPALYGRLLHAVDFLEQAHHALVDVIRVNVRAVFRHCVSKKGLHSLASLCDYLLTAKGVTHFRHAFYPYY